MAESNALTSFSGLFRRPLRQDNGHKWNSYGTNYRGFYGVRCVYCNSTLTKKNGFRVNTFQRCYACNKIFNIPAVSFKISDLPRVYCPQCNTANEIKIARNWRCTECNRSFYDENRILNATSKKRTGLHGVSCIHCNSTLTRKGGKKIRATQRCQACANIFYVRVTQRYSNLSTVICQQCNFPNKTKLVQGWKCMECNKHFCDGDGNKNK